jgi:hypothetical protein
MPDNSPLSRIRREAKRRDEAGRSPKPVGPANPAARANERGAPGPRPLTPDSSSPSSADPLQLHMPADESVTRDHTEERAATASGGTSGAEDSTRAAGYVADLTARPEPAPGPPIPKNPSNFVGPEREAPAPGATPESKSEVPSAVPSRHQVEATAISDGSSRALPATGTERQRKAPTSKPSKRDPESDR